MKKCVVCILCMQFVIFVERMNYNIICPTSDVRLSCIYYFPSGHVNVYLHARLPLCLFLHPDTAFFITHGHLNSPAVKHTRNTFLFYNIHMMRWKTFNLQFLWKKEDICLNQEIYTFCTINFENEWKNERIKELTNSLLTIMKCSPFIPQWITRFLIKKNIRF